MVKNPPANAGDMGSILGSGRSPGEEMAILAFLPGKSHGKRILAGYSPWGCKRVRHDLAAKLDEANLLTSKTLIMSAKSLLPYKVTLIVSRN